MKCNQVKWNIAEKTEKKKRIFKKDIKAERCRLKL